MRLTRLSVAACLSFVAVLASSMPGLAGFNASDLPARLTDQEFWKLSEDISEPDGRFQSDNLLSNEIVFTRLVPDLMTKAKPGGVYMGVGPEQNFTYIAAIKPKIAIITDIRRNNLHMHLMYKALFELSKDRAEFVSRLFTKPRPAGLSATSSVTELMNAYWDIQTSDENAYSANLAAIQNHLTKTHSLPLSQADLDGVALVYRTFYWYGPSMNYSANTSLTMTGAGSRTTYWDLMTQGDANGEGPSYLGSEEKFAFLKDLETRNLVVPVVGNFSGPKAIRAVGTYLKEHNATVTAFYVSNVESYLRRDGSWPTFCANVATLPLDEASVFIRPSGAGSVVFTNGMSRQLNLGTFIVDGRGTTPMTTPLVFRTPTASLGAGLVPMQLEVKNCN